MSTKNWKSYGYACLFDDRTNKLLTTTRLKRKGNTFKIGKKEVTFETWDYSEKKRIGRHLEAMRISEYQRCRNGDWLNSTDF